MSPIAFDVFAKMKSHVESFFEWKIFHSDYSFVSMVRSNSNRFRMRMKLLGNLLHYRSEDNLLILIYYSDSGFSAWLKL